MPYSNNVYTSGTYGRQAHVTNVAVEGASTQSTSGRCTIGFSLTDIEYDYYPIPEIEVNGNFRLYNTKYDNSIGTPNSTVDVYINGVLKNTYKSTYDSSAFLADGTVSIGSFSESIEIGDYATIVCTYDGISHTSDSPYHYPFLGFVHYGGDERIYYTGTIDTFNCTYNNNSILICDKSVEGIVPKTKTQTVVK